MLLFLILERASTLKDVPVLKDNHYLWVMGALVMKRFLTYLSVVGLAVAMLPVPAKAGSNHGEKGQRWHRGYAYTRGYYGQHYPSRWWRHRYYYGYYGYPQRYYWYPGLRFSFRFD